MYDNGGKDGDYKDFTHSYLQVTAPAGGTVNFIVYGTSGVKFYSPDSIAIYDGALGNTSRRIFSSSLGLSSLYFYETQSRYATFIQGADGTYSYTGFEIDVAVDYPVGISANSCGTVSSSKDYAVYGETVTMEATPNKGCALDSVVFKLGWIGARTMDVNVDVGNWWSTGKRSFSFVMPADTVDVTAYFSAISAHNEKAIIMPTSGTQTITIPDGVSSFRVYDNGGKDGTYSNSIQDTLILHVPSGYVLNLSGTVSTENCCDVFNIYDGSSTSSTLLKSVRGDNQDVGSIFSSGEYLTLTFKSDGSVVRSGLDLMVRVSKKTESHKVVALSPYNAHGTITVSPTTATMGTTVTVSATPNTGYKFVGVMLTNAFGDTISVVENTAGGNSLTFPMDFDSVNVKPYFATQQMGFDSYGCLSDGWYFRFKDGVLTQGSIIPDVGANINNCWFKKTERINSRALTTMKAPVAPSNQYFYSGLWFELEEATSITLGGDLDFGGAVNGTCQMDFRPLAPKTLTGNGHKIKNFCMVDTDVGFFDNANATVKNVIFEDPYLVATSKAGVIGPTASGSSTIQNVTVTGGTIQGEIAGALIGEVSYNTTLSYINVSGATVRGRVAGGMVGNVSSGYTLSLYNTSTTRNSVSGSTVSAYYANGFTAGSAYAGGVVGNGSVSFSNPLPLLSDNTITAENSIGSDWNVYLGGYVGYQGSSTSPLKGGQATGMTISSQANANAAVYAGGYFGYVNGSLNLWQSGFDGSISGADYAGGFVGAVAKTSASTTLNIVNTYSTGSVAGSSNVGYIVGRWTASNGVTLPGTGDAIYNNYHFGTDVVAVGIGSYTAANWTAGSDYVYDNVRNATGSLAASGTMGLYRYSDLCAETYHVDFFEAGSYDLTAAAPTSQKRNGVATEAEMKSDKFVALLNENRADTWGDYVWFISDANNGLPQPTSQVAFNSNSNAVFGSYVTVELVPPLALSDEADYGFYAYSYKFCNTAGNTGSATSAMVGWTKSDGTLSSDFVTAVNTAAAAASANTTYIVNNSGYNVDMSTDAFLPGTRLRIFEPSESYAVTYQYCPTQNSCDLFETFTDMTFMFLSPQVSTVLYGLENTSFVPYVIALDNQSGIESDLSISIDYYDGTGAYYSSYGAVSGFITFGSLLDNIGTNIDIKSIVIRYSPGADVPKIAISNTTEEGFYVDVYPYDATTPLQARQAVTGNASVDIPYGVSFKVRDFDEKVGYTRPSYSAKLSIVVDDANACPDFTDLGTEDGDMNFAPWSEMTLDVCYTKSWNVTGLTDDATLGLEEIKKAILNNTQPFSRRQLR